MIDFTNNFAKKYKLNPMALDVVISLIPGVIFAFLAYGIFPVLVIIVSILSALITEFLFSLFFLNKKGTTRDLTAVISAMLLAFLLPPFTPLYTIAFGASMAMIFGKLAFGGMGKNRFNPAVIGRDFTTLFLISTLATPTTLIQNHSPKYLHIFNGSLEFIDRFIWDPVGNIGNYSPLFLLLGGIYLIYKKRISFYTPLCFLAVLLFGVKILALFQIYLPYSFSGATLIAAFYILTDPMTTSNTKNGKIFQGIIFGLSILMFLILGLKYGVFKYKYFTFGILSLNFFVPYINKITKNKENIVLKLIGLGIGILIVDFIFAKIIIIGYFSYIMYIYILYAIFKFCQLKRAVANKS